MIPGNHYKYVDPEYINELADGDPDFIIQIIDIYLTSIPENINNLVTASAGDDYGKIIFYTHKLRGSFNFIGGKQMIEALDKIDELCNAQTDLPTIRQLTTEVAEIAEEVVVELKDILENVAK